MKKEFNVMPVVTEKQINVMNMWQVRRILLALQEELSQRATITQAIILLTVAEHGVITFQDLCAESKIPPASVSRLTAMLGDERYHGYKQGKNLLTIEHTDLDRKQKQARLSPYGKAFIKEVFGLGN